jgi:hypothetical protein
MIKRSRQNKISPCATAAYLEETKMQVVDSKNYFDQMRKAAKPLSAPIAWWTTAVLLLILLALPAHAQFGSSLSGTVLDPTKAVIPHATVTLTNTATQQTQTSTTNEMGAYHFSELPSGSYSLVVKASGFKTTSLTDLPLAAETPRNVDVTLQAGGATESVQVNGDLVPLLQTADANIGTTLESEEILRLPTFGADAYELLRTAPGITGDGARSSTGSAIYLPNAQGPGGSNSGIFQTENQVQISAAGQRQADNTFSVDGVSVNSLTHGGAAVVSPSMEAIGAMNVVSTSLDASDGRNSGAQIKIVTKSGSNTLHGSLFGLYDEKGLNAYNRWGGPNKALPVVVDNDQRSYAASIGGPAVHNKVFYFLSFAGFTTANNNETTSYVETPDYRAAVIANRAGGVSAGIFADPGVLPRIRKVLTPSCDGLTATVNCNLASSALTTTGLDIGSLTTGGTGQIGVFPASNQIGGGLDGVPDVENVQLYVPAHSRGKQFNARGDWYVTPKDQIAGSVYFTKLDNYGTSGAAGSRPQGDLPFKPLNSAATAIYIHTFSPSWLNEFRVNSTRFADNGIRDAAGVTNFGIPFVNVQTLPWGIQFGATAASTTPSVFAENTHEARDMVTHIWHSHALRAGMELRMEQDNDNLSGNQRPTFAMQGLWTMANDAPIYEQITANPLTGGPPLTQRYFRSEDIAAYAQDDWKVRPNLTLNLGLRWEFFTPLRNKGYEINYPVLGTTAGQELSGITLQLHNHLWNSQPSNFAPKVGFAYSPEFFKNKLVARGGFAIAYNHLDIALFNNALEDGPKVASFGLCCASASDTKGVQFEMGTSTSPASFPANPALSLGINPATGFPCEWGSTASNCVSNSESYEVYGALPNTKQPVSYLYSLEMQYELPYNMVGTVGYTGSVGRHYARLVNQNFTHSQVNSPVFAAYFAQTDSNQSYNAMNVNLTRHVTPDLFFSAYYTWSKSLDQMSNGDAADSLANQTNPADNGSEWGPSDYDARQRITITGSYELPHLHTGNKYVKQAANGWQVNGVMTHHTAFPWTPVTWNLQTSPLVPGANVVGPTRPLKYLGGAGDSCSNDAFKTGSNFPKGGPAYFDITTPVDQTNYTYKPGIGRNSFRGPCYFDIDMSFAKQFTLNRYEHNTQLRLQVNAYNIFNILQLQPIPNGNTNGSAIITNSTFGESLGGDAGRVIEITARIQF